MAGLAGYFVLNARACAALLACTGICIGCSDSCSSCRSAAADMPVIVSMLNSYSGWAAAATGFTLGNNLLITTGALVGSSGAILSYIMCKAMNRSIISVVLGGFGGKRPGRLAHGTGWDRASNHLPSRMWHSCMENSSKVIIVPGYGMAVAQAQHAVKELYEDSHGKGHRSEVRRFIRLRAECRGI